MGLKVNIDKYIWIAQDKNGMWVMFMKRPFLFPTGLNNDGGISPDYWDVDGEPYIELNDENGIRVTGFNGDWRSSLHKKIDGKWVRK